MVQMKVEKVEEPSLKLKTFISHMVQMKVNSELFSLPNRFFFISHMVQMKEVFMRFINNNQRVLYIPHGSDES